MSFTRGCTSGDHQCPSTPPTARLRSGRPAREVPRRARQAPARGRHRPVRRGQGRVPHYIDDPYVEPGFTRAPVFDDVERGHRRRLRRPAGGRRGCARPASRSIRMVENGGDFGGTWYWNRYPGAMCDVESYFYLPLLEELGYMPKHKYSLRAGDPRAQPARSAGTTASTTTPACRPRSPNCAGTRTRSAGSSRTNRGDRFTAQYVAMANGPLSRPKLPGIPGIDDFKGHTFHTSRWDYGYTGGDSSGGLDRAGRQARRHHRHRRDGDPVRAAPGRVRRSSSTSSSARPRRSTCAATPDRSGLGRLARARLAEAADGQLQHPGRRRRRRTRTWSTTAGPTSSAT